MAVNANPSGNTMSGLPGNYFRDLAASLTAANVATQGWMNVLKSGINVIQSHLASFVQLANPAAVTRFKMAVDDLYGVIGRAMTPALMNMTAIIQKVADYFHAMSPEAKSFAVAMTAAAVGLTVATAAAIALNTAFASMTGGLSLILGTIGGMVAGMVIASKTTDVFRSMMDRLMPAMARAFDLLGKVMAPLADVIMPLLDVALTFITKSLMNWIDVLTVLQPYIDYVAAFFIALSESWASFLGVAKADDAPGRAPPAVRSVTAGTVQSAATRAYSKALEVSSDNLPKQQLNRMTEIRAKVDEIHDLIARGVKALEEGLGGIKGGISTASNIASNSGAFVLRQAMSMVVGK